MANETSYAQQQQLIDEFGRLDSNKVDINEVTQYSLMKKMLESKGKDFNSLLPPIILQNSAEQTYRFPSVFATDSSSETHGESTNELMNYFISKKYTEGLLKINNKDIASLISHVKFLRVPKENNKPIFDKSTEINFSTHYSKNSLDTILQDTTACGLTSLKIDVISNTGAYYAYKGTMNLFFANARALVDNSKYNLLLTTPTKDEEKKPVVYSLIFGWANTTINPSEEEKVRTLYEEDLCLLLSITNYELQFQADGSVTLVLNFIGAAETAMDGVNADVLIDKYLLEAQTSNLVQQTQDQKKKLADAEASFSQRKEIVQKLIVEKQEEINKKKNAGAFETTIDELYVKGLETELTEGKEAKELEKVREQTKKIETDNNQKIKGAKYYSFMTKLYELSLVYTGKTVFSANSSGSSLQFVPLEAARYERAGTNNNLSDLYTSYAGGVYQSDLSKIIERAQKVSESRSEISVAEQELIDAFTSPDMTEHADSARLFRETVAKGENSPPVVYGNVYFNYLFVGDIVGMAAQNAYINLSSTPNDQSPYENMRYILGTLDLEQTKTIFSDEQPKDAVSLGFSMLGREENEQITLDIATIPIAYNVFSSWFVKNVIAKGLETYSFNQFLKDFLNDCVLTTIHSYSNWESKFVSRSFEKSITNTTVLRTFHDEAIEVFYTDLPYKLEDVFETKRINPSKIKNMFQDEKTRKKITPFVEKNNLKKYVYRYAFVYGKFGSLNRAGNFKDNLANGIFHFYVGATTGIMKDIKFVPMNSPSRYAAQVVNSLGGANGKPPNEKFNVIQRYDVNISCFGFQYFKPGQIIYVDTSLLGFGKPQDLNSVASKFTLGGYYLVTNVSHDIEANDFSTSIVAKFLDRGRTI
jgi:hypothetical protein